MTSDTAILTGPGPAEAAAGQDLVVPDVGGGGRGHEGEDGEGGSGGGGDGGHDGPSPSGSGSGGRSRRGRGPLIAAISVGCITALLVAVLATSKGGSNAGVATPSPLQDKPAPEIGGPLVSSGRDQLSAYRGRWVWVNFFASWCVPCQQEQADLVRFQNAHAGGDAVIFGVRFDDPDVGAIQALMDRSGGHWPIVDDPNAKIDYGVTGPPESFLVSPGGVVLVHVFGQVDTALLERLLSQARLVVTTPQKAPVSAPSVP